MSELAPGAFCRAACSAPARYIGDGWCIFVSAVDNNLCLDRVNPAGLLPPKGAVLPHIEAARGALVAMRRFQREVKP